MEANAVDGTIVTLRQQKASGKTDACERGEGGSEGGGGGWWWCCQQFVMTVKKEDLIFK